MTPFEQWFSQHVAPGLPKDFPPQALATAKKQLAECWNAALEAGIGACEPTANLVETIAIDNVRIELAKLRVTP